jgi:peptide/nickel transport system permease protein
MGTVNAFDIYTAVVWGARDATRFGMIVALGAAALGVLIGTIGAYLGGWSNWAILRITDSFLTFPLIAALILASQIQQSLYGAYLAGYPDAAKPPALVSALFSLEFIMILFLWMPYARLVNALVLSLKSSAFVEAARALGAGGPRILARHLIPNSLPPVIVLISRDIGAVVLLQAALTFIHMQGNSIWGGMLANGRDWVYGLRGNPFVYWWVFVPVSLAIVLFSIGWGLVGDGLNHLLNPHKRAAGTGLKI